LLSLKFENEANLLDSDRDCAMIRFMTARFLMMIDELGAIGYDHT
jgi:hypothetical protein